MTEPIEIYVYESSMDVEPVYLDKLIVNNLISIYVEDGLVNETVLPIYKTESISLSAGLVESDLYFNLEGDLSIVSRQNIIGNQTGLVANLSKAVSYLRRLF
jgi:hypothetical protein